jgi:hypothetical protein
MTQPPPLAHPAARTVEQLLGLRPGSLTGIERRANGDFALTFDTQPVDRHYCRVLRIPARRVFGYRQRPRHFATVRAVRAGRRENSRRFARWLIWRVGVTAPIVDRAVSNGDLSAVDELRAAILALAPSEPIEGSGP